MDEKSREELNAISKTMRDERYTPEAIAKGTAAGEKLLGATHPELWESAKSFLFNEQSLGKFRETAEKNAAEGKSNIFPFPDIAKLKVEGKGEELMEEPLD